MAKYYLKFDARNCQLLSNQREGGIETRGLFTWLQAASRCACNNNETPNPLFQMFRGG